MDRRNFFKLAGIAVIGPACLASTSQVPPSLSSNQIGTIYPPGYTLYVKIYKSPSEYCGIYELPHVSDYYYRCDFPKHLPQGRYDVVLFKQLGAKKCSRDAMVGVLIMDKADTMVN